MLCRRGYVILLYICAHDCLRRYVYHRGNFEASAPLLRRRFIWLSAARSLGSSCCCCCCYSGSDPVVAAALFLVIRFLQQLLQQLLRQLLLFHTLEFLPFCCCWNSFSQSFIFSANGETLEVLLKCLMSFAFSEKGFAALTVVCSAAPNMLARTSALEQKQQAAEEMQQKGF